MCLLLMVVEIFLKKMQKFVANTNAFSWTSIEYKAMIQLYVHIFLLPSSNKCFQARVGFD